MGSLNIHLSNAAAYAAVFEGLISGASTVVDLAQESGLAHNTTRKLIHALRRRKLIHVAAWETDALGRHTKAAYALGHKPDVAKPPAKTSTQRSARSAARKRSKAYRAA